MSKTGRIGKEKREDTEEKKVVGECLGGQRKKAVAKLIGTCE